MPMDRRDFLARTGLALAVGAAAPALLDGEAAAARAPIPFGADWAAVRRQFVLDRSWVHLGGLLLAAHPAPVRRAINRHRRRLDANPVHHLRNSSARLDDAVRGAAARYLGASAAEIALTDSTTMGLGLLYNGLAVGAGQELLTSEHDFFATHEALELSAARSGATVRRVRLYDHPRAAGTDEIVARVMAGVNRRTRVVALTWVHSSSGVKLPIGRIAAALDGMNAGRPEEDRALLCVDGVHGLGVESAGVRALGCDFLVAGCHKWLFGPRGTGILWGRRSAWRHVDPIIPSFTDDGTPGGRMTPGGFHSFEHRWALARAFEFHRRIGKRRVASRTHQLAREAKQGLARMPHVDLLTPLADRLSAGIVCFNVRGRSPHEVVERLRARRIIATVTPYDPPAARLAPTIFNTSAEVARALAAIRALG